MNADHHLLVSALIKDKIADLDELFESQDQSDEMEIEKDVVRESLQLSGHYHLGSPNKACSISELVESHSNDISFRFLKRKLTLHLNTVFSVHSIPLPDGRQIYIAPYHQVFLTLSCVILSYIAADQGVQTT